MGDENGKQRAEELFNEFLRRCESGEEVSIQEFSLEHSDVKDVLLGLYSLHCSPGGPEVSSDVVDLIGELGAHARETATSDDTLPKKPAVEDTEALPDEEIGPYRILERLGSGTFGVVYLAQQERPIRRRVALKVLKRGMDTEEILKRFEAERQALARMDHDAIVKVHDAGTTDDGRAYFVMDFIPSEPLGSYLGKNRLDLRARLELFTRICDGVHHAHTRVAVLHRDLKPANILVGRGDEGEPCSEQGVR